MEHPLCNRIYITWVHKNFECDVFMPPIDLKKFQPVGLVFLHLIQLFQIIFDQLLLINCSYIVMIVFLMLKTKKMA